MAVDLISGFGKNWAAFIARVGEVAQTRGMRAYVVGGPVRDLLLGQPSSDVDLMLEGDGIAFAKYLHANWPALFPELPLPKKPVHFPKFGTAKLLFPEKLFGQTPVLDFSTARKELYPASGAQPVVSPGDLRSDLARRDFSVNAMAVSAVPEELSRLIDFFHGKEHLAERKLVVLHARSFEDDPARLIRALRFAARLGFEADDETRRLFDAAIQGAYLERLPKFRLFDEFRKALCESKALPVLRQMEACGMLHQIHPRIALDEALLAALDREDKIEAESMLWKRRLRALFAELDESAYHKALMRFELPEKTLARLGGVAF